MKCKILMIYYEDDRGLTKMKQLTAWSANNGVEQPKLSSIAGGNANWYLPFGKLFSNICENWTYICLIAL